MKVKFFSLVVILCFTSCKLVSFQESSKALSTHPILGTIGVFQDNMMSNEFNEAGLPELDEKIKLSLEKILFNNRSLRKYNRQVHREDQKLKIIDSIDFRPPYFKINISDKVGLIAALNDPANQEIRSYLEVTGNNLLLTSVWIYFPPQVTDVIENATEVYLINDKKSFYSLELLYKDKTRKTIDFNEGTPFGYGFSEFCWKENYKREAVIAALRDRNKPCPGNTKKDPEKVYSKDIFEKLN